MQITRRSGTAVLASAASVQQRLVVGIALALIAGLAIGTVAIQPAQAQTNFKVLYTFQGPRVADGASPHGTLTRDGAGNLYGTTVSGGDQTCGDPGGCGIVFKVASDGAETVLHRFAVSPDGAFATAGLVRDIAGNLYGTTYGGGNFTCVASGCGTIFQVDSSGIETVLYRFTGKKDGANPHCGLVQDAVGNLFGTTVGGGTFGRGTVFRLDTAGREEVLYNFTGGTDGGNPYTGLVRDAADNLYGTTLQGGASGYGTVFKVAATGKQTVLYSFTNAADGSGSQGGLVRDAAGNLYGTTESGGTHLDGTVFKVDTTGTFTVLYAFTGGGDGASPLAGLLEDSAGDLFGTTYNGGTYGYGTVFKLSTAGKETVLYSFTGGSDGSQPMAGLVRDEAGNLYGATLGGGTGYGTVFELAH